MPGFTITAASAIFMLTIPGVFPAPQRLQGFGVDEAFDTEPSDAAVVQTGVDGIGVAGWVPREVGQTITLMAASQSFIIFENWIAAQDALSEILYASALVTLPAIGRKYTFSQGALTRYPALPNARRTLQQRQFHITWMPPEPGTPAVVAGPI